jgi:dTDP-4-dehydrorhamnose 3,5-epimerase
MILTECEMPGVQVMEPLVVPDIRGRFVKIYHQKSFKDFGLEYQFKESFYTVSKKNVIRGMHYQLPPRDSIKTIFVTKGAILDVVLDIRKGSPTFGNHLFFELSEKNHRMIYIPAGCAHGFLSMLNDSCVMYSHTEMYDKECEKGIHFDSFGMNWGVNQPIVSDRDSNFILFKNFESPFCFNDR